MKSGKLCFVSMRPDLASKKIRADQVAAELAVPSLLSSEAPVEGSDVLIYVKHLETPEKMAERKKKGIIQVYDPVDNYDFKDILKRRDYIDGIIAASLSHKIKMEQALDVPAINIPHHHANFNGKRIEIKKDSNLIIGYIGDKTHFKPARFVQKHFKDIYVDIKYKDLEKSYLSIDMGFAYRKDKEKILYNSSLKLLNYMSFGIPSVFNIEMSYLELANHGEHCLFAQSKDQMIQYMEYLRDNFELRKYIADQAFLKAKDYHISKIALIYKDFLKKEYGLEV